MHDLKSSVRLILITISFFAPISGVQVEVETTMLITMPYFGIHCTYEETPKFILHTMAMFSINIFRFDFRACVFEKV